MYPNPQIHGTQDTLMIHVGYKGIHSRIRISSPTCGALGYPQTPEIRVPHVSRMYPACIPHVSRMYPACILITSEDTRISHVSNMYPACLNSYQIHLSLDAFEIHVSHHVSWMYPACILITLADTCISHVSRMYLASQIRTSS